ncbi:MAG TPA: outer membrane beta-barrel protein [Opitutaceae bacterium]|nr:outer membrane beta-barrel protein [Opitutaceae bacterium]
MRAAFSYRAILLALVVGGIFPAPASALLTFNDGRDQVFVTGNAGLTYDSNIFANSAAHSDTIYSGGAGLEYKRHAGIISADASAGISISRFDKFSSEDFSDPHIQGEFSASDERTSGDLTLAASRQSQADVIAGVRALSWTYDAGLNTRYRVNDRYSIAGNLGYNRQNYVRTPTLVDLTGYSGGANLFYSINSARDFFAGYQFRLQETSRNRSFGEHSFNAGLSGKILPKLNGTVSLGYSLLQPHGSTTDHSTGSLTESVALTWNLSRRLKITGDLSQYFTATSINGSVDTTSASLLATYAMNARLAFAGGISGGHTRFLGASGGGRRDTDFSWNAGVDYNFTDNLKVSTTYTYYENWSTLSFSDFIRHTLSVTLSARF